MISKNHNPEEVAKIHPDNRYQTPLSLAVVAMRKLRQRLWDKQIDWRLDLGCGDIPIFAMALHLANWGGPIHGIDIRNVGISPGWYVDVMAGRDFSEAPQANNVLIIGNPPFHEIRRIVQWAHATYNQGHMCLLLKLEFLSPKGSGRSKRNDLHREFPPTALMPIGRRPSWYCYTPEKGYVRKTNSTDYAFYYWDLGRWIDPSVKITMEVDFIEWNYHNAYENLAYGYLGAKNPHAT
jgi:hypothetical protein